MQHTGVCCICFNYHESFPLTRDNRGSSNLCSTFGTELGSFDLCATIGTETRFCRFFQDRPAIGAEFGAVGILAALRTFFDLWLDHGRSTFRAEFGPGSRQCSIFGTSGGLCSRILSGFCCLLYVFHYVAKTECVRQAFQRCPGLLSPGLSDLVRAGTVFLAETTLSVKI